MRCYSCGRELTEQDYCTACGADVGFYKKIYYTSERLYNEGLDKARVRDLSGAETCLKESLKLNKANIDARNLLGLVYYETGEVVAALTQWVISKNFKEEKNLAGDLLDEVQKEPQRLETLGRTAKKYNLALGYARQGSLDLATIQLKRILQLNPGFLRARELLALLYLNAGEFEKAKLECSRCLRIDSGDTTARRYMREAVGALTPVDGERPAKKKSEAVRYQSGNEMIIQPSRGGAGAGVRAFGAAILGIAAGIAVAWFLILPTRAARIQQAAKQEIAAISEESDSKSAQIKDLDRQIEKLEAELGQTQDELLRSESEQDYRSAGALLKAVSAWLAAPNDAETTETVRELMLEVEADAPELADEDTANLYRAFLDIVGEDLAERYAESGLKSFRDEDDENAIRYLSRAVEIDSENPETLYTLGRARYRSGDINGARETFESVISSFAGTDEAEQAQNLLAEINNLATPQNAGQ